MADNRLPERLPQPLSTRDTTTGGGGLFSSQGREFDVAIDGIPFRVATHTELPHTVETADVRKEQVDMERDPGEQSLDGWWRRSQNSWHMGAGSRFQEIQTEAVESFNFWQSSGVDPLTKRGEITLQPYVLVDESSGHSNFRASGDGKASALKSGDLLNDTTTVHTHGSLVDGFVHGSMWWSTDGSTVYEGDDDGTGAADLSWPMTGGGVTYILRGLHRLWAIGGRRIWQVDTSLADTTAQDPIWESPDPSWTYTDMVEVPGKMLFAGNNGAQSSIQYIELDANGGLPTISGATIASVLPQGELVTHLESIAGQYIGIATNRGFRVGVLDDQANAIAYGPLIIHPDVIDESIGSLTPSAMTVEGDSFLVAFEEWPAWWRVSVGEQASEGVFPFCEWYRVKSGTVITSGAGFPFNDSNLFYFSVDDLHAHIKGLLSQIGESGWLETGWIRFRTSELKAFRRMLLEVEPLNGTVSVDLIQEGGGTIALATLNEQGKTFNDEIAFNLVPSRKIALRFTFARSETDTALGPEFRSYQVKAFPVVKPQRMISLPLLCYDFEQAASGMNYGSDGYAQERLDALYRLEDKGGTVTYQTLGPNGAGQEVLIEKLRMVYQAPNDLLASRTSGPGGILVATLRTVN